MGVPIPKSRGGETKHQLTEGFPDLLWGGKAHQRKKGKRLVEGTRPVTYAVWCWEKKKQKEEGRIFVLDNGKTGEGREKM